MLIHFTKPLGACEVIMSDDNRNSSRRSREKSEGKRNNESYNRDYVPEYWGHKLGKKKQQYKGVCS